jgi:hypothetical protein
MQPMASSCLIFITSLLYALCESILRVARVYFGGYILHGSLFFLYLILSVFPVPLAFLKQCILVTSSERGDRSGITRIFPGLVHVPVCLMNSLIDFVV